MNKFLLLTIMLGFGSIFSVGLLGVNFDMITQALGTFSFLDENIELSGCECVDASGNSIPCDDADSTVTADPLCPFDLNP